MKISHVIKKGKLLVRVGFFHVFVSNVINRIVSFAYTIFIVRILSKYEYGTFEYANNIYYLLILLSGIGISSAFLQLGSECADNKVKMTDYYAFSNRFGITVNFVLSILILLVGLFIPLPIQGANTYLLMMALLPVLQIIRDLQVIYLRVNLHNKEFGYANTTNVFLTSIVTILGAWFFSVKGIIAGQYIVAALMILITKLIMKVPFSVNGSTLNRREKKELLQIAGISALNNALSHLFNLLGALILGLVLKNECVIASYKVATTIPFALIFIPSSVIMFAYPYFARHKNDREWVSKVYRQITLGMSFVNMVIVLCGVLFAEPIISLFFGRIYLDSVEPFRILMVSYFISGTFHTIAGNLLVTQRKLKFNLFAGILGALFSMVLNVLLIPELHSVGAAMTQLITNAMLGIISTVYFIKVVKDIPEQQSS